MAKKKLLIGLFAFLVGNTATGFASRLTRGLAFAATAFFSAFAKITSLNSFDMFHSIISVFFLNYIIAINKNQEKKGFSYFFYLLVAKRFTKKRGFDKIKI